MFHHEAGYWIRDLLASLVRSDREGADDWQSLSPSQSFSLSSVSSLPPVPTHTYPQLRLALIGACLARIRFSDDSSPTPSRFTCCCKCFIYLPGSCSSFPHSAFRSSVEPRPPVSPSPDIESPAVDSYTHPSPRLPVLISASAPSST